MSEETEDPDVARRYWDGVADGQRQAQLNLEKTTPKMTLTSEALTPRERIEEAHGVWELAAQRVCAMAEMFTTVDKTARREKVNIELRIDDLFFNAVVDERMAFKDWQVTMLRELGIQP